MARARARRPAVQAATKPAPKLDSETLSKELGIELEKPEPKKAGPKKQAKTPREVGPATQTVYDRIKELRAEGKGIPTIAKTLNEEKVPTLRGGTTWHNAVVHNIIRSQGFVKGVKKADTPADN